MPNINFGLSLLSIYQGVVEVLIMYGKSRNLGYGNFYCNHLNIEKVRNDIY